MIGPAHRAAPLPDGSADELAAILERIKAGQRVEP